MGSRCLARGKADWHEHSSRSTAVSRMKSFEKRSSPFDETGSGHTGLALAQRWPETTRVSRTSCGSGKTPGYGTVEATRMDQKSPQIAGAIGPALHMQRVHRAASPAVGRGHAARGARSSCGRFLLLLAQLLPAAPLWGAFERTVYDCEYDLDADACVQCAGTAVGLDWIPKKPSCIHDSNGCCQNDGFEYFMKSSLADYAPGRVTSFFFPRDDMILF